MPNHLFWNPRPSMEPLDKELWTAAREGEAARVASLLAQGADPKAKMNGISTALMAAAQRGHFSCVAALAPASDHGARDHQGFDALSLAAREGHAECAAILAPLSIPSSTRRVSAAEPLDPMALAAKSGSLACARALAPFFPLSPPGRMNALMAAAAAGDLDMAAALLELGADPRAHAQGFTALMAAVEAGSERVVSLLAPLSDQRSRRVGGDTALALAAKTGRQGCAEILLAHMPEDCAPTHLKNAARDAGDLGIRAMILAKIESIALRSSLARLHAPPRARARSL